MNYDQYEKANQIVQETRVCINLKKKLEKTSECDRLLYNGDIEIPFVKGDVNEPLRLRLPNDCDTKEVCTELNEMIFEELSRAVDSIKNRVQKMINKREKQLEKI